MGEGRDLSREAKSALSLNSLSLMSMSIFWASFLWHALVAALEFPLPLSILSLLVN